MFNYMGFLITWLFLRFSPSRWYCKTVFVCACSTVKLYFLSQKPLAKNPGQNTGPKSDKKSGHADHVLKIQLCCTYKLRRAPGVLGGHPPILEAPPWLPWTAQDRPGARQECPRANFSAIPGFRNRLVPLLGRSRASVSGAPIHQNLENTQKIAKKAK